MKLLVVTLLVVALALSAESQLFSKGFDLLTSQVDHAGNTFKEAGSLVVDTASGKWL